METLPGFGEVVRDSISHEWAMLYPVLLAE